MRFRVVLALSTMVLWACGADTAAPPPAVGADASSQGDVAESPEWASWATDTSGPYRVGYREVTITYSPSAYDGERTLTVGLWYPTDDTEGEEVAYMGIIPDVDGVLGGASLAEPHWEDGLYPVHLHSHGNMGYVGTSANLMVHFASHGWVSVAPEHVGNT
ncbi:MAG: hypothetical protein VX938_12550, partial [Myxococcota bacterium]|nr:hypothetical protein [Myxococcota bacterium]